MKKIATIIFVFVGIHAASSQTPSMVEDIRPGANSSFPQSFTEWNGRLYFHALSTANKRELWYYEEGSTTAVMVTTAPISIPNEAHMAVYNNKLYFSGQVSGLGQELCSYDGINPPQMVADIQPGNMGSLPYNFQVLNGKLYFDAGTVNNYRNLYSYDGINPPVPHYLSSNIDYNNPGNYALLNGKFYFSSNCMGRQVMCFDPATQTLSMIQNIGVQEPDDLVSDGNKLYMTGKLGDYKAIYSYTGSGMATLIAGNGLHGIIGIENSPLVICGNALFFEGVLDSFTAKLYKYDLSSSATTPLTNFYYKWNSFGFEMKTAIAYGSTLYFSALIDSAKGYELYKYDGSAVTLVAEFGPGKIDGNPSRFKIFNNQLYFTATTSTHGTEPYKVVENVTGIQQLKWMGEVTVYPNPAANDATLTIKNPDPANIRVILTDLTGRELFSTESHHIASGQHQQTLPVGNLPAGYYFYHLVDPTGVLLYKGKVIKI